MAVSGNEPISASNLAALAGQLGREVLFAGIGRVANRDTDDRFDLNSIYFPGSASDFDHFVIEQNGLSTVVATSGSTELQNYTTVTVTQISGRFELKFETHRTSGDRITRIIGIRSGGGSS